MSGLFLTDHELKQYWLWNNVFWKTKRILLQFFFLLFLLCWIYDNLKVVNPHCVQYHKTNIISCVEAFTPAGSESCIETKAIQHYTQDRQPPAPENLLRGRERTHENTEPRNIHPPDNHGKGNKGPTNSTLTSCELIHLE